MDKVNIQQRKYFLLELFSSLTFRKDPMEMSLPGFGSCMVGPMMFEYNDNFCTGYIGISKLTGSLIVFITLKPWTGSMPVDIRSSVPFAEIRVMNNKTQFSYHYMHNAWENDIALTVVLAQMIAVLRNFRESWALYCKRVIEA